MAKQLMLHLLSDLIINKRQYFDLTLNIKSGVRP